MFIDIYLTSNYQFIDKTERKLWTKRLFVDYLIEADIGLAPLSTFEIEVLSIKLFAKMTLNEYFIRGADQTSPVAMSARGRLEQ
jgi:hypothetical protein